jgi:hypothetical protein
VRAPSPLLLLAPLVAIAAFAECKRRDKGDDEVLASPTCIACSAPTELGALADKALDETSGVVASSKKDDLYFVHNDSGDTARFFAVDGHGARLATFVYSTAAVLDCEDIARGPCADGTSPASPGRGPLPTASCLFVGDIGDNFKNREQIVVYRVREPDVIADATVPSEALPFVYPDGPHDAETLLIHPKTGALVIISKEKSGASTIYEAPLPLTPGVKATLKTVGTVAATVGSPRFTGGDVRADGTGIVLRTYTHVLYAPMRPEQTIVDALKAPLCSLPVAREEQGESVGWQRDGKGFVTISEGVGAKVNATRCP